MGKHLHKKYNDDFVQSIFQKYMSKDLSIKQVLDIQEIRKTGFFELLQKYKRKTTKRISKGLEEIIISELIREKKLIDNRDIPIRNYNYSYIRDQVTPQWLQDRLVRTCSRESITKIEEAQEVLKYEIGRYILLQKRYQ